MSKPTQTTKIKEEDYIRVIDLGRVGTAIAIAREIHDPVGRELLKLLYPVQERLYGAINVEAN